MRRLLANDKRIRALLARHDDRLLRDIGASREEILGPERHFWAGWRAQKAIWRL